MSDYDVTRRTDITDGASLDAIVVRGRVPIIEAEHLLESWDEQGLEILDARIADHLGVTFVTTTREASKVWREELGVDCEEGDQ